jgi:hypothetical protein
MTTEKKDDALGLAIQEANAKLGDTDRLPIDRSILERVSQAVHTMNRTFCMQVGDFSQLLWCDAPEWQKESAKQGVLRCLMNPNIDASDNHEEWMSQKVGDGWKWGPVKNVSRKEHPCMKPFKELPFSHQVKDDIFRLVCIAAMVHEGVFKETNSDATPPKGDDDVIEGIVPDALEEKSYPQPHPDDAVNPSEAH